MKGKLLAGLLSTASVFVASRAFAVCLTSTTISSPGYYELCSDYINQPIRITANDVTLDCGGHKVWTTSNPTAPTEPCNGTGRHGIWVANDAWWIGNITVMNCNVAGWDSAIRAGYVSGLALYGNVVHHSWDGFDLNQSIWINAADNWTYSNGAYCSNPPPPKQPGWNGDGVDLDLVDHSTFTRIYSYSNKDHGVTVTYFHNYNPCGSYYNHNITYRDSHSFSNQGRGFNLKGLRNSTFVSNYCSSNAQGPLKNECDGGGNNINMPQCY